MQTKFDYNNCYMTPDGESFAYRILSCERCAFDSLFPLDGRDIKSIACPRCKRTSYDIEKERADADYY